MAAPNIVNVATITGITTGRALTTSLTTALVMNPASSGKAFKINSSQITYKEQYSELTLEIEIEGNDGSYGLEIR